MSEVLENYFSKKDIPEGYKEIENVTGVYFSGQEIVITGTPDSEDENHNCDAMGCSSVEHVLFRALIFCDER